MCLGGGLEFCNLAVDGLISGLQVADALVDGSNLLLYGSDARFLDAVNPLLQIADALIKLRAGTQQSNCMNRVRSSVCTTECRMGHST